LLYNTEAIVVRNIAYGETHAILTLLTPSGLVAALARGAKKPQSRYAAGVQQCVQGIYTLYRRTGMGTVSQVEVINSRRSLREDLQKAAYAAYFCELVQAVAEEAPNGSEAMYRSFVGALDRLESGVDAPSVTARVWETKVLRWLGASPDWTTCVRCHAESVDSGAYSLRDGGFLCADCAQRAVLSPTNRNSVTFVAKIVPKVLKSFERVPWERLGTVTLNQDTLDGLRKVLEVQLRDFAGLSLKSRDVLHQIDAVFDPNESEP
jgi:DNA repair protein RecO (recombination protein O)